MFASYDMNPIARNAIEKDRLAADIRHVDHGARWPIPAGVIIALGTVAVILF